MERLRMTTVTPASLDPSVENESDPGDLVHNSMAMDEGQRLQRRKNQLISQAETIIHINAIIGAKLQVLLNRQKQRTRVNHEPKD